MSSEALSLLLVDCVERPPERMDNGDLTSVDHWFRPMLEPLAEMRTVSASVDDLWSQIEQSDGVIISGSPRDAYADDTFTRNLLKISESLLVSDKPVFGVCYGHQLLARAAGGQVIRNPKGWELGDHMVEATPAANGNPLFSNLPPSFLVKQCHRDIVSLTPLTTSVLLSNSHAPCQALEYRKNAVSVQFHPEFTPAILFHLWTRRFMGRKEELPADMESRMEALVETPVAARLLTRFIRSLRPAEAA